MKNPRRPGKSGDIFEPSINRYSVIHSPGADETIVILTVRRPGGPTPCAVRPLVKRRSEIAKKLQPKPFGAVPRPYPATIRTAASGATNRDAATSTQSPPGMDLTELPTPLPHDGCANRGPIGAYPLPVRKPDAPANPTSESPCRSRFSKCKFVAPACDRQAGAGSGGAHDESRVPVPQPATQPQQRQSLVASLPVGGLGVQAPRYQGACDIFCT
jgi:hypothetical protein